jgi:ribosomal protein S1
MFTQNTLTDANEVQGAISSALVLSRAVFQQFPIPLTDLELLIAAAEYKQGEEIVQGSLGSQAAHKQERLHRHREFEEKYQPGSLHIGTALRVTRRYAIIQLQAGDTAILSARHLEAGTRRQINLEDVIQPGDSVRVEVVHASAQENRIEVRSNELLEVADGE